MSKVVPQPRKRKSISDAEERGLKRAANAEEQSKFDRAIRWVGNFFSTCLGHVFS